MTPFCHLGAYAHKYHSVAYAAAKVEQKFHHEDREEHEVRKYKKNKFFVAFVRFVVRS
jgi:hypothetical protein